MLENIYDDSIEYPFLQKNYNLILKKFAFTPHGLIYQHDILWEIGESGSLKNRLLKKWLSYNTTTQEQIQQVFEDIKTKKDLLVDKKYSLHLDNILWSTTI